MSGRRLRSASIFSYGVRPSSIAITSSTIAPAPNATRSALRLVDFAHEAGDDHRQPPPGRGGR